MFDMPDFNFPFQPYDIQTDFMNALYKSLENKKLAIFESPTGTGKSLSLICGALTWMQDYSARHKTELEKKICESRTNDSVEDWFTAATKKREHDSEVRWAKCELKKLQIQDERIKKIFKAKKESKTASINSKRRGLWESKGNKEIPTADNDLSFIDDDFIPDDYDSESENSEDNTNNIDEDNGCLKIYYCSRTHSQLSQFVNEIKKTSFSREIRVTSLASRQNLCINDAVKSLANLSLINERCLDLQNSKGYAATKLDEDGIETKRKKVANSCRFYKQNLMTNISSEILTGVKDSEELEILGRNLKACPYYGSKYSIKDAQVVVLPYNTILHKKTRQAYKISLKDNIVIVDEAHNLLETLANIHSVFVTLNQFEVAHSQLKEYFVKYGKRFSAKNVLYIRQILYFIKSFIRIFRKPGLCENGQEKHKRVESSVKTVHQILCDTLTENLHFLKIIQFIEKSKLPKKLYGFSKQFHGKVEIKRKCCDSTEMSTFLQKMGGKPLPSKKVNEIFGDKNNVDPEFTSSSSILNILELMRAFLCSVNNGRVLVTSAEETKNSSIKYFLLNPASQFHDIVKDCRSVILAGGTMSPMNEFREQLFLSAGAELGRIEEFSYGHVVLKENVLPIAVSRGPTQALDFTYKNRSNTVLLSDVGTILVKICSVVPGGIVCFFPSYDYERNVYQHLEESGVLANISLMKKVFREPKDSSKLDSVLRNYAKSVNDSKNIISGAILLCVVGGKMSEGINFSDDLGRCVVMLGLPFPNSRSPELREKMNYLDKQYPPVDNGQSAGVVFYENLCFKAVNQSVGRSIRHKNDYATILLLDQRYDRESSKKALPSWISNNLKSYGEFEQVVTDVKMFFENKTIKLECLK